MIIQAGLIRFEGTTDELAELLRPLPEKFELFLESIKEVFGPDALATLGLQLAETLRRPTTAPQGDESFTKAEKAAGIPGIGHFFAIWSWGAFRAGQSPVGIEEAAALAKASPELCRMCHNTSESERKFSKLALDRVTKPPPEGKYDPPWKAPKDYAGWSDGSYGLFDLLAGSVAHLGIHEGKFTPLVDYPATVLYQIDVQLYLAGVMVKRIINNPNLIVLVDDNPLETWANVRACTSSPSGFQDWQKGKATNGAQVAAKARDNFFMRALEIGIDPAAMAMPFDKKTDLHWLWPGAEAYFKALGVKL